MRRRLLTTTTLALVGSCSHSSIATPGRHTQSLDGTWQIVDGKSPTDVPAVFSHTVPVPGLANLARPAIPDVDKFISRENLANRIRSQLVPAEWLTNHWTGKVEQDRNYFWYRTTFTAPGQRAVALLKIC